MAPQKHRRTGSANFSKLGVPSNSKYFPKQAYLLLSRPHTPHYVQATGTVHQKKTHKKKPCENCMVLMQKGLPSSLCIRCVPNRQQSAYACVY